MRKVLSIALVLALCLGLSSMAMADKLGLGMVTSYTNAANATADAEGKAQINTVVCTVLLGDDGIIKSVVFDVAQTALAFNAAGEITTDTTVQVPSKVEKGDDYGMRAASPIGKEYFEQMAALEAFCVGKTVDQVINTPADDADLASGATVELADHFAALSKAAANAK
ncbi:MAG: hypothetical protein GX558_01540 [Clostridiales bacterium]|nr:hypothetical protein [Clostridiales bacterium]